MKLPGIRVTICAIGLALGLAAPASAVTISEYEIELGQAAGKHVPLYIHPGPDGNLWITDSGTEAGFDRISVAGERLPQIAEPSGVEDFVVDPGGTVYYSADAGVGRRLPGGSPELVGTEPSYGIAVTAAGAVRWGGSDEAGLGQVCRFKAEVWGGPTSCSGVVGKTRVTGLTRAPDGTLWAAFREANEVRVYDTELESSPAHVEIPSGSGPARIAAGPDGKMWITEFNASAIDRVSLSGSLTRFPLPAGSNPNDIVVGPDGALWFTEYGSNKIGRMTTAGALTNEYAIPTPNAQPTGLTVGLDGAIWFTETATGKIGRLAPDPPPLLGEPAEPPAPRDTAAPRFSTPPAFIPKRFAVGARPMALASAAGKQAGPLGSKLELALSEPATVTIAISRALPGRKAGRACVAPTRSNKAARKCTRYLGRGSLQRRLAQGGSSVPFSGRIGIKALAPGAYRATLTAKDGAGNVSRPASANFTILGAG